MAGMRKGCRDYGRIMARLGKETDAVLAAEISCTRRAVCRLRQRMRIPAFDAFLAMRPLMGKVPDVKLARHFRVSANHIHIRRRRWGIPTASAKAYAAQQLLQQYVRTLKEL